jgi:non-specific serine/threonine protein kinase
MGVTLRFLEGRLVEAQTYFQNSLDLYRILGDDSGIVSITGWLGIVYRVQGDLEAAQQVTVESLTLARQIGDRLGIADATGLLGDILRRLGDYHEARRLYQEAQIGYEELGVHWGIVMAATEVAQISIILADYPQAQASLLYALKLEIHLHLMGEALYSLIQYGNLIAAQGMNEKAVAIFSLLETEFGKLHRKHPLVTSGLNSVRSKVFPAQFEAAMKRGQSLNVEKTVETVISELSQPLQVAQSLTDSLTTRELEILGLLAAGLSNRDIADKIILAPGTVKWYVSDILSKLGVNSRTQAIARARQLKLLP